LVGVYVGLGVVVEWCIKKTKKINIQLYSDTT
jgi:hypothetical protein